MIVKTDLTVNKLQKETTATIKEIVETYEDVKIKLRNNKENLQLVAGECLKAIEGVDGLKNTQN